MSQLLTDKERPLRGAQPGDDLSAVARARTLTVLLRLDGRRKRSVLEFLYESRLLARERTLFDESDLIERRHNIVSLEHANLFEAHLIRADLSGADLSGTDLSKAHLIGADLSGADLSGTDLIRADLSGANLFEADLSGANLFEANLSGANLFDAALGEANLGLASLIGANLIGANLSGANLSEANLIGADLSEATGWTEEQLLAAYSLVGTTMPDGQVLKSADNPDGPTFEEWLKSKGRGEDGENCGPS